MDSIRFLQPKTVNLAPSVMRANNSAVSATRDAVQLSDGPVTDTVNFSLTADHLQFGAKKRYLRQFNLPWTTSVLAFSPNDLGDPDLDAYEDYINGNTSPEEILDQIIREKAQINTEDGSVIIERNGLKKPQPIHGNKPGGGTGAGAGTDPNAEPGQVVGQTDGKGDKGEGPAGSDDGIWYLNPGQKRLSASEVAALFGEDVTLPDLRPSMGGDATSIDETHDSVKRNSPGKLHVPRSLKRAMTTLVGQLVAEGKLKPGQRISAEDLKRLSIARRDRVFIDPNEQEVPSVKVALHYVRDCSGSMDKTKQHMVQKFIPMLSYPIRWSYGKALAEARGEEYDEDAHFRQNESSGYRENYYKFHTQAQICGTAKEFYDAGESGGTLMSSGLNKVLNNIREKYPEAQGWNNYVFLIGDGDNFESDTDPLKEAVKELLAENIRMLGYIELKPLGSHYYESSQLEAFRKMGPRVRPVLMESLDGEVIRTSVRELLKDIEGIDT